MIPIEEFLRRLTMELRASPPRPIGDHLVLSDAVMGGWLAERFSLDELEVFRKFEDEHGETAADALVELAFLMAGLPRPVK